MSQCSKNDDCISETCAEASSTDTDAKRYCQTSFLPEDMVKCLFLKLDSKAGAVLKSQLSNGDMSVTFEYLGDRLAESVGRERCLGIDGWKFDPVWRHCIEYWDHDTQEFVSFWNQTTGLCDQYYCDNYEDCKIKCESTPKRCNSRQWDIDISEDEVSNSESLSSLPTLTPFLTLSIQPPLRLPSLAVVLHWS